MQIGRFSSVKVSGISTAVPDNYIPTSSFNATFGESVVKDFVKMVGIEGYHKSTNSQTAADLALNAANDLFESQSIDKSSIKLVLFVTQKPDRRLPSTALYIHSRLDLSRNCIALDLNLACSGYIYAMNTAAAYLLNLEIGAKALVLTGDTSSRTMSPEDRTTIMLFGDSGTATLVERTADSSPPLTFALRTDGARFKSIITPAGGYRNTTAPIERVEWSDGISRSDYDTRMKGMEVFGFSITDVPKLLKTYINEESIDVDKYDAFVMHQANMYILKQLSRKVKLPWEKFLISINKFGNNSSNSIPLTLCHSLGGKQDGLQCILGSGFGAGLSWGVIDFSIDTKNINPIIYKN